MAKTTYKDAGVDLDKYQEAMARLPDLVNRTHSPRVSRLEGGFAGLFSLDFSNPLFARNYRDPVLVSCTDGVGTKLKVAALAGVHDTVGIDLVAMSVNDALCCGAEPLFFLDYVAMPREDPPLLEQIVRGISEGCLRADCSLLGGETAILPDVYSPNDYDLAGFCVGVVDRENVIDGTAVRAQDVLLGIASSGFHSNGYSLIRKVVFEQAGMGIDETIDELGRTVAEVLLEPTRIYVRAIRGVMSHNQEKNAIHGIAHITGGGLRENLERILPEGLSVNIQPGSWSVPPEFDWLQRLGEIDRAEMERVFNMGLGLVLVVDPDSAKSIRRQLTNSGMKSWVIGEVTS